jgi:hypothetical protein
MELGRIAYESYCEYSEGVSLVSGAQLPSWEDQADDIKNAWIYATNAVASAVLAGIRND